MSDDLVSRLRASLPGIAQEECGGDNLAILLASFFEPGIESDELDDSGTWKQGAIDACDSVLDAIHAHYATALTEARAEIERLRAGINGIVNCQGPMTRAQVREACAEILDNKTVGLDNQSPFAEAMLGYKARALAAESELSTLRARVREVVGPFSRLDISHTDDIDDSALVFENEGGNIVLGHLRAARQLNEDLK